MLETQLHASEGTPSINLGWEKSTIETPLETDQKRRDPDTLYLWYQAHQDRIIPMLVTSLN